MKGKQMSPNKEYLIKAITAAYDDVIADEQIKAHDEAYHEGRSAGYDEGWDDAVAHIQEFVDYTGFVDTPKTAADTQQAIRDHADSGMLCTMFYMNFLHHKLQMMKE